jgi:5-methyltetrahydropteroyltriglutamate--homocysteine methyltransferase
MKRSTDRILTTHVGSLPRPPKLFAMMKEQQEGKTLDPGALEAEVRDAVAEVVRKQTETGLDIICDGEMGKVGFIPYVNDRLAGFEPGTGPPRGSSWANSRETRAFPEYYDWASRQAGAAGSAGTLRWVCTGPISYRGIDQFQKEVATFRAALAVLNDAHAEEAFVPAISPSNVAS